VGVLLFDVMQTQSCEAQTLLTR
jgi:hypothetical protein